MVQFVQQQLYTCDLNLKNKAYFIFPITKGSMSACMGLVGLSTSKKVKNHCSAQTPMKERNDALYRRSA